MSKIYFKDSANHNVHGFDAIQVSSINGVKKLWLGESKLYGSGKTGVSELAKDFKEHVQGDYLRTEFSLITNKLPETIPDIEYWRNMMDKHQRLDKIFSSIVVPMVCTYTSKIFENHKEDCLEYLDEFKKECSDLLIHFEDKLDNPHNVEVILMLLPVESKDKLNQSLDQRLKNMQAI